MDSGAKGLVYVADTHNYRITAYTKDGHYVTKFAEASQFGHPFGIAVDSHSCGHVYVADTAHHQVEVFTKLLKPIRTIGSQSKESGDQDHLFNFVGGVAVDPSGPRIYVTDAGNQRVQVYAGQGGNPGSGGNQPPPPVPKSSNCAFSTNRKLLTTTITTKTKTTTTTITTTTTQTSTTFTTTTMTTTTIPTCGKGERLEVAKNQCLPCEEGKTFMPNESHQLKYCRTLTAPCTGEQHEPEGGAPTLTSDRLCASKTQCTKDQWEVSSKEGKERICEDLTVCQPGYSMTKRESTTSDRKCVECPKETFQPQKNQYGRCTSWSKCRKNEYVSTVGTSSSDLECDDCRYDGNEGSYQNKARQSQRLTSRPSCSKWCKIWI